MGNVTETIQDAFDEMKTNIIDSLIGVASYIIEQIVQLLDRLWTSIKDYLKKSKATIELCKSKLERKAAAEILADGAGKMNEDVKQNLQTSKQLTQATKRAIAANIDVFTAAMRDAASAA